MTRILVNLILLLISYLLYVIAILYLSQGENNPPAYSYQNVSIDLENDSLIQTEYLPVNISSTATEPKSWKPLYEKEVDVDKDEKLYIISNMGLNSFAIQSHIVVEGFNNNTGEWEQVLQCPEGIDGPLETKRFVCHITIDSNTTKIRPVFKAGWSSEEGKEAITHFGKYFIIKATNKPTPIVYDDNLKIQNVMNTSIFSTSMKFIDKNDILMADTHKGMVYRAINGNLIGPLIDLNVSTSNGLLGLDSLKRDNMTYVYLYFTKSGNSANGDDNTRQITPECDCLYRYNLVNNSLVDGMKLFNLSSYAVSTLHNSGIIKVGPDQNIYLMTGAMNDSFPDFEANKAMNYRNGSDPDGRSGILRFTLDGDPVKGILGDSYPLNLYFAYGIRNGFGMDFDPLTGNLWDTENGPDYGDEINLVEPGFNSGFNVTEGIWNYNNKSIALKDPVGLVDFQGKGKYSLPEFTWEKTVGPIALTFFNSTKLGSEYNNTMFVSDFNNGYIYNFKLTENRTALDLVGPLEDKVANKTKELSSVIFASGLGQISDIDIGSDGYLYLLSLNDGIIYRVIPSK